MGGMSDLHGIWLERTGILPPFLWFLSTFADLEGMGVFFVFVSFLACCRVLWWSTHRVLCCLRSMVRYLPRELSTMTQSTYMASSFSLVATRIIGPSFIRYCVFILEKYEVGSTVRHYIQCCADRFLFFKSSEPSLTSHTNFSTYLHTKMRRDSTSRVYTAF